MVIKSNVLTASFHPFTIKSIPVPSWSQSKATCIWTKSDKKEPSLIEIVSRKRDLNFSSFKTLKVGDEV